MINEFSKYDDAALISLVQNDSKSAERAFSELYGRYYIKIYTYCVRMTGDKEQAKDIFHETFVRFFEKIKAGEVFTQASPYIFRIARNLCLNFLRDKKVVIEFNEEDFAPGAYNTYEADELFGLIVTALGFLDDIHKEAFIMKKFQNMSYKEISELCGISFEGAKKRVRTATEKIMKTLEPYIKDVSR